MGMLIFFGVISILTGLLIIFRYKNSYARCCEEVEAEVVDIIVTKGQPRKHNRPSFIYTPVYRFRIRGIEHEAEDNRNVSYCTQPCSVGQRIRIRVNPHDPHDIMVPYSQKKPMMSLGGACIAGGAVLLIIALILMA